MAAASLFSALGVHDVRLALLDVQGYELPALEGLQGGPLPELLIVEADDAFLAKAQSSREKLINALRGYGYGVFDIHGNAVEARSPLTEQNLVAVAANRAGHLDLMAYPSRGSAPSGSRENGTRRHGS